MKMAVHLTLSCQNMIKIDIMNHRPQTTDHRPQTTDHRPQTTDHRPQTTNYKLQTIILNDSMKSRYQ